MKLKNKSRITIALILVIFLVLIRMFEDSLFYDPLLNYFKMDYNNLPLPHINNLHLFLGFLSRYFLNSIISLGIIYVLLIEFDAVKFATVLYLLFFILLILSFFIVLSFFGEDNKVSLFYIRRFLIQPLFLLLFLPAFYYQRINK